MTEQMKQLQEVQEKVKASVNIQLKENMFQKLGAFLAQTDISPSF